MQKHSAGWLIVGLLLATQSIGLAQSSMASSGTMMKSAAVVKVPMTAQNGSGQNGTATLRQSGSNVVVTVSLSGGSATPQPVHIHQGTCANLNPKPRYPLNSLVNGKSTTTLPNMKLSSLETGGYAINAHKSLKQIKTYVSCGDIPKAGAL
jgi:hypothetical protein